MTSEFGRRARGAGGAVVGRAGLARAWLRGCSRSDRVQLQATAEQGFGRLVLEFTDPHRPSAIQDQLRQRRAGDHLRRAGEPAPCRTWPRRCRTISPSAASIPTAAACASGFADAVNDPQHGGRREAVHRHAAGGLAGAAAVVAAAGDRRSGAAGQGRRDPGRTEAQGRGGQGAQSAGQAAGRPQPDVLSGGVRLEHRYQGQVQAGRDRLRRSTSTGRSPIDLYPLKADLPAEIAACCQQL